MTRTRARTEPPPELADLPALLGEIARGTGTLVQQHAELLRCEARQGLAQVGGAAVALGAGSVLVASGGALAALMAVHGLKRASRLPLWACYGAVGGALGLAGLGLLAHGRRQVAGARFAPHSAAALEEDLQWIQHQIAPPNRG